MKELFFPNECGWLRRRDLEALKPKSMEGIEIWERPNGGLVAHDARSGNKLMVYRSENGEMKCER